MEEKNRDITNKSEEKATAEADKTAAAEDLLSAQNEQQQLENENADLHKACDFTLQNFEVAESARARSCYPSRGECTAAVTTQVSRPMWSTRPLISRKGNQLLLEYSNEQVHKKRPSCL